MRWSWWRVDERAVRQFIELEDSHFWFIGRRAIFMHVLARALPEQPLRILDVGCGAGGMLGPLARFGEVRGFDESAELVQVCRDRGFADVAVAGAYELPVADGFADLVTLFDVIEHIPDDVRALRECGRALRSGGLVFISTPAYQFLYANNDRVAHHERRYTASLLRGRLLAAGLDPVRISYFNTLLFPMILPAVLAGKLWEKLVPPGDRTNLSVTLPPRLNALLAAVMSSERRLLARRDLPFGHSLIALARRP
jgi:SAM-dependent methyltransferase